MFFLGCEVCKDFTTALLSSFISFFTRIKGLMKKLIGLIVVSVFLLNSKIILAADYPSMPDLAITVGKLCDKPVRKRYPEQIDYCERDVTYQTKEIVIAEYDQKDGYIISKLPRADFKIDHLIPLCVGGSNDITNLWPQHKSVYFITDPLEPALCEKMAQGRLKQADAVRIVIEGKTHLDRIPTLLSIVKKL